jgi:hypothetical protein
MNSDYAIEVIFNERGYWSKAYTYKSTVPYSEGAVVVVPTGKWYSVGKVVKVHQHYSFDPAINYKRIVQELIV